MDEDSCLVRLINLFVSYKNPGHKICSGFYTKSDEGVIYRNRLSFAAFSGFPDLVNCFISKGSRDWNAGFSSAIQGGHLEIVKLFVHKNVMWEKGIVEAASIGYLHIVKFLVEQGIKIPDDALYWAKNGKHHAVVDYIVEKMLLEIDSLS